jgi:hypothetical protein
MSQKKNVIKCLKVDYKITKSVIWLKQICNIDAWKFVIQIQVKGLRLKGIQDGPNNINFFLVCKSLLLASIILFHP